MRFLLFILIFAAAYSCDTSTHKYVSFKSGKDSWTGIGWDIDANCSIFLDDSTISYDGAQALFYSDNSTLSSFQKEIYEYVNSPNGIDSVKAIGYFFDLTEDDIRVQESDSILVTFLKGGKQVYSEILYKEESESTFWDRLPLPKLH